MEVRFHTASTGNHVTIPFGEKPFRCRRTNAARRHPISSSSWPTTSAMPMCRATAGRNYDTPNIDRIAERGVAADAGLRQFRGLLGDAAGADHRALPVPAAARPGGAAGGQDRCRPAAGASDLALAAARGRLRHHADRQMASGRAAECSARSRAATTSSGASAAARSITTRTRTRAASTICGTATSPVHDDRLPDRSAGRSRGRHDRRLRRAATDPSC